MKKILLLLMFTFLIACNDENQAIELSENGEIAKQYVEHLGYEVVSFVNEDKVSYAKEDLVILPSKQFWSVQHIEPVIKGINRNKLFSS